MNESPLLIFRLQNHFNYVIFTAEKALYASENITCETIEFKDNIDVIRDIEMLFKTLDEEGKIPKGTSDTWFHKLKRGPKSITISYPTKRTNNVFTVKHYAGDVDYNAFNCLEKNIETLSNDLIGAMSASTDPIIHRIFELVNEALPSDVRGSINIPSISSKGNNPQRRASISIIQNKTICWKFQHQLITLMTMLRSTESHFIRFYYSILNIININNN
jgi:myosin heavy subunit